MSSEQPTGQIEIADEFIEQVENAVGMGHGAWDMVPAKELLSAAVRLWAQREVTHPTPADPQAASAPPQPVRQSIEWLPGPAQGNSQPVLYDGEQYLCAIQIGKGWEMAVVTACVGEPDDESDVAAADLEVDGEIWSRDWSDVDWYVPVKFLCPPMPAAQEKTT